MHVRGGRCQDTKTGTAEQERSTDAVQLSRYVSDAHRAQRKESERGVGIAEKQLKIVACVTGKNEGQVTALP